MLNNKDFRRYKNQNSEKKKWIIQMILTNDLLIHTLIPLKENLEKESLKNSDIELNIENAIREVYGLIKLIESDK